MLALILPRTSNFGNTDFGVCHASVTCVKSSDCISPSILQAFLFVARRAEHRDIGLNSDTASTASWVSVHHQILLHIPLTLASSRNLMALLVQSSGRRLQKLT
jgi:hypothetical protein